MNVMLSDWDEVCALSVEMEPLRSANDVGVLLQAMRQYPAGLPDRVSLIAAELPAYSTPQIALLLARLDTVGTGLVETSSRLADTGSQVHLLPPPTTCVVCGEPGLMVDRKPSGGVRPPSSPTVVSERGILQGILHSKTCGKCGALHGMSYADGGSGLSSGKQMPYEGATARGSRWCQMSPKIVWENSLLYAFESQAVFSHTGYETFASEYEWKHGGHDVSSHLRRSLAHSWLAWSLLRWLEELELPVAPLGLSTDEELDASLLEAMHKEGGLVYSFVDKWGRLHEMVCRKPKPGHPWCMCYIIDGHMKCKRCALRSVPNPDPDPSPSPSPSPDPDPNPNPDPCPGLCAPTPTRARSSLASLARRCLAAAPNRCPARSSARAAATSPHAARPCRGSRATRAAPRSPSRPRRPRPCRARPPGSPSLPLGSAAVRHACHAARSSAAARLALPRTRRPRRCRGGPFRATTPSVSRRRRPPRRSSQARRTSTWLRRSSGIGR